MRGPAPRAASAYTLTHCKHAAVRHRATAAVAAPLRFGASTTAPLTRASSPITRTRGRAVTTPPTTLARACPCAGGGGAAWQTRARRQRRGAPAPHASRLGSGAQVQRAEDGGEVVAGDA